MATKESATTDRPWIRQPLPLYLVPCSVVSRVSTQVSRPPMEQLRKGTGSRERALDTPLPASAILDTKKAAFS